MKASVELELNTGDVCDLIEEHLATKGLKVDKVHLFDHLMKPLTGGVVVKVTTEKQEVKSFTLPALETDSGEWREAGPGGRLDHLIDHKPNHTTDLGDHRPIKRPANKKADVSKNFQKRQYPGLADITRTVIDLHDSWDVDECLKEIKARWENKHPDNPVDLDDLKKKMQAPHYNPTHGKRGDEYFRKGKPVSKTIKASGTNSATMSDVDKVPTPPKSEITFGGVKVDVSDIKKTEIPDMPIKPTLEEINRMYIDVVALGSDRHYQEFITRLFSRITKTNHNKINLQQGNYIMKRIQDIPKTREHLDSIILGAVRDSAYVSMMSVYLMHDSDVRASDEFNFSKYYVDPQKQKAS